MIAHIRPLFALGAILLCFPTLAQTQEAMRQESCAALSESEKKLDDTYKQALDQRRSDKTFSEKFEKAQRDWTAYRDSYLDAIFPVADKRAEYGTAYDTCRCDMLVAMNEARIRQLEGWTTGLQEGDICIGSRAVKR